MYALPLRRWISLILVKLGLAHTLQVTRLPHTESLLLNNQQVTRTQHTRQKQRRHTDSKTAKHSHTHKTHSRNDERQRLCS